MMTGNRQIYYFMKTTHTLKFSFKKAFERKAGAGPRHINILYTTGSLHI